jgi:LysR family transcriptional regulator, hydrogen peroxide-inducible genes activator
MESIHNMHHCGMLDLTLIETFVAVARLRSVREAARALHRSQPAVSHRLRLLQEELGVALFERIGRRLVPTQAGERLLRRSADLLLLARDLAAAATGDTPRGEVRIGTLPTVASHLMVPVLARLFRDYPELGVRLVFDPVPRLVDQLRAGAVDTLVLVGEAELHDVEVEELGTTRLVCAVSPRLAPRRRGRITPVEMRRLRLLAWEGPADPTFERVHGYVRRHGLANAATPRIPHIETLRRLAAAGAGYAILPEYTVRQDPLCALAPAGIGAPIPIRRVLRRGQIRGAALDVVCEALDRLRAGSTPPGR